MITVTRVSSRVSHSLVSFWLMLFVPRCMITAVGHSCSMKDGANLIQSSRFVLGKVLFSTLYLLDRRRPTRCLGIESPNTSTVRFRGWGWGWGCCFLAVGVVGFVFVDDGFFECSGLGFRDGLV